LFLPNGSNGQHYKGIQSGASQTYPYFQQLGLDSHKSKIMDRVMLRCLCCAKAYTNITAKATFNPIFLLFSKVSKFTAEEQSEECAFSGQIDFSRIGRGKNREISFPLGKKKQILQKLLKKMPLSRYNCYFCGKKQNYFGL